MNEQAVAGSETHSFLDNITLEHVLYAVIVALAALLRLGDLGIIPLSPDEASMLSQYGISGKIRAQSHLLAAHFISRSLFF